MKTSIRAPMNLYFQALQADTKEEANIYFTRLVTEVMDADPKLPHEEALELVNANLGYDIGYLDDETQKRALELYPQAEHPILGRTFGDLDADTLIAAGMAFGKAGLEAARKVVADARADCAGATEVIVEINKG
jgi:hypothetical protein